MSKEMIIFAWFLNMKSRMTGDCHVRFRENAGVKFPCVTRLSAMLADSKKAKKMKIGILLGIVAGIIDVIPMILQNLTWDANLSAFTMWVIIGFLIAVIDLNINSIIKGILIAFLALLPSAILIGWQEPISLIPITVMTITLGGLLGFSIEKIMMNNNNKN